MKKILLLLVLFSNFVLSKDVVFSNINECKTDVYFGNGILTKEEDAEKNARLLEDAIIEKIGIENFDKKIGKVDYAYNRSDGQIVDLLESLLQKADGTGLENINGYTAAFSLLAG